jgi:L-asparaginase II
MANTFLRSSTKALRALKVAQARHARLKAKADRRLEIARGQHAEEVEKAAAIEAAAWQALLDVPGMTVTTAAVLASTSESTVNRWASRGRQGSAEGRAS